MNEYSFVFSFSLVMIVLIVFMIMKRLILMNSNSLKSTDVKKSKLILEFSLIV